MTSIRFCATTTAQTNRVAQYTLHNDLPPTNKPPATAADFADMKERPFLLVSIPKIGNGKMHFVSEDKLLHWKGKKSNHRQKAKAGGQKKPDWGEIGYFEKMIRAEKCAAYMEHQMAANGKRPKSEKLPITFDASYHTLFPNSHQPSDQGIVGQHLKEYWAFGKVYF